MWRVKPGCGDPCAGLLGDPADIQNVIEMTMSDDDSGNAPAIPSAPLQFPPKQAAPSDETTVDEIQSFRVSKNIKVHSGRSDL